MNLDKRIKRHVIGARHDFFAVTQPGHEDLCQQDLQGLSDTLQIKAVIKGGVAFNGRLTDLYLANLHLRTAGRILMRLTAFKASSFHQLEKQTGAMAWSLFLPRGVIPQCNITARHSRLHHTQAITERISRSIAGHWADLEIGPGPSGDQTLFVRLLDDVATLSLDSSGENLYRRGLKTHATRAPLRETLAAVILRLAGYNPEAPLADPMCGAGAFSLEAALVAKTIAPGANRQFAFMQWPAFRPQQWNHLKRNAAQKIQKLDRPVIRASDKDGAVCAILSECVRRHSLDDAVRVRQNDFFDLYPDHISHQPGLIVLNPPYGRRLAGDSATDDFYHRIAAKLRRDFKGWRAALLVPDKGLARALKLPFKAFSLSHGGLELTLLTGKVR